MIYLNGDPVNVTLFPDHTSQVWKLDERHLNQERATVLWEFTHEAEIMHLAQLKMLLDESVERVYLHLDFLPYGRQDKVVSNESTFALQTFAQIINRMMFNEIFIMDPHSKVALGIFNCRTTAVYPHGSLSRAIRETTSDLLCYPDAGAVVKYTQVYDWPANQLIYGEKVRDQSTGHIASYNLVGECKDKRVMIVDDICDGGMTFEILATDLINNHAKEVNLFVTHGLFSKGLAQMKRAGIRRIFTAKGEAVTMSDGGVGFKR